ncbi:DegT/DnrJ/EryC1/StrS family aminotransferase [Coxiella burnetii]|uniref:DegT/DnrJ/EryC1/StrS family aminotransferase n=1 Tax=Coxiella burnetii TaxID=777 RepID=UPI00030BE575|nr:DegT/DnrJ/EryC1/StrS family aminotransferase [Coxiella burnetii]ATN85406.1 perosamine synthetase [Coxiella burnetii str. Schperling]PHH58292.1 DegT/DnrJ/EryC1/StrS family aminotransferase [Coxiella burnetii]
MTMIKQKRKIPIAIPSIGDEEWQALKVPLDSGWLTQGPKVAEFERLFAVRHQAQKALATTSCTTALHLALAAMGVGPGDEVIVPAFTWIATANAVLYCGATPVFADVDRDTFNINVEDISRKITDKTKAIIPVHLFGACADIDAIRKVIPNQVMILEDAACAAGAAYKGKPAGILGDMGAFSFHPRKSITTGEGGMLTTNNTELAHRAEIMRNHGAKIPEEVRHLSDKPYLLPDFKLLGFNYRMTDLQAAVGIVQLAKLDAFINERDQWANYYYTHLKDLTWLRAQRLLADCKHAWQACVFYVDPERAPMPRNTLMEYLKEAGIATRPGTHAVHLLSFYREKYGIYSDDFPGARDCDHNTMAIPLHNRMTKDDYDYVIETLRSI